MNLRLITDSKIYIVYLFSVNFFLLGFLKTGWIFEYIVYISFNELTI